jgi:heterodisulfide reductase subunit B
MNRYGYFPGCSLEHSAAAYADSIKFVAATLDLRLETIDDWNCCGATEYIALNKLAAYALVARTLALAETQLDAKGRPQHLIAPCSACYLNLRKADRLMQEDRVLSAYTNEALAAGHLHYDPGSIHIRHLIEVLIHDVGLSEVAQHVAKPLTGLRVAPYYGCLLSRPHYQDELDKAEYPTELDDLLRQLGADVPDFSGKTWCCGGHMTQISTEVAYELLRELLQAATDCGADIVATACPMCQLNLDARQ